MTIKFERYKSYYIDLNALRAEECEIGKDRSKLAKTPFVDAFNFFTAPERTIIDVPVSFGDIKCNDGDYVIQCGRLYVSQLLRLALSLNKENVAICECVWFYVGSDECMEQPMTSNHFFLAAGDGRIIREYFNLTDCFDLKPDILTSYEAGANKKVWMDEKINRKAWNHRMYDKFLETTETGKIQIVKERLSKEAVGAEFPDEPKLASDTAAIVSAIEANTSLLKVVIAILIGAILTRLWW